MARYRADIAALNHIAQILIDARRLYARAASFSTDADATLRIERTLGERAMLLDDVRQRVSDLSGTPQSDGSLLGKAHMAFFNARTWFDNDLDAALAEVARGEDYLRKEIRKAMRREDLYAETRAFLGILLDRIVSGEMRIEGKIEELRGADQPLHH